MKTIPKGIIIVFKIKNFTICFIGFRQLAYLCENRKYNLAICIFLFATISNSGTYLLYSEQSSSGKI